MAPPTDSECQLATETTSLLRPGPPDVTDAANASPSHTHVEEERTIIADQLSPANLAIILSTAWFGIFLGAADSTIIATLTAPISSAFDSLSLLSWLATAYLISTAACQPILGRLTDIFGRGPGLVFSNLVFAAGNLLCALANSQWAMIAGRVVAGIGGGGLVSIATFLNSDLVPLRRRGLVGGIATLWFGCGCMLGSVMGGFLHDNTEMGWRLAFLVQVPPSLVSALMVHLVVKVPPKQSEKSCISRIDFLGAILVASSMVFFVLGLNSGGNIVPWTHPFPPTMLTLSVIMFAAFLWWEGRALIPIIPVTLLRDPTLGILRVQFVCVHGGTHWHILHPFILGGIGQLRYGCWSDDIAISPGDNCWRFGIWVCDSSNGKLCSNRGVRRRMFGSWRGHVHPSGQGHVNVVYRAGVLDCRCGLHGYI